MRSHLRGPVPPTSLIALTLSGASATAIRNFFSGLEESRNDQGAQAAYTTTTLVSTAADPSGLLTPLVPALAECTSGGLGSQDTTASARGGECLSAPSPIPQDVPGTPGANGTSGSSTEEC